MTMPESVSSFSDLVGWLLKEHHEGKPYRMAKALGVSAGLPFQWRDGTVKAPASSTIARICEVYELDYDAVIRVIYPAPSSSGVRRSGSSPFSRRAGRIIASVWDDMYGSPITRRIMSILAVVRESAKIFGRLTSPETGEKIKGTEILFARPGVAHGLAR